MKNSIVAVIALSAWQTFAAPSSMQHVVSHPWPFEDSIYPPTANEWANGNVNIVGWQYLGKNIYPEPGMISGRPASEGSGHCGIVDYDGWVISARSHGVSRKAMKMFSSKCGYNKPIEDESNE